MPTRKYVQGLRADSAEQTRRRILDALYEQLRERPAETVSVDRLAQSAGVVRATVYTTFGSRSGLFCALGTDLLQRGGFEDLLQAAAHPDARETLRLGIHRVVAMYATDRKVRRALYSMAQLDGEAVGGAVQLMEQGRATGMAQLARRLADQGLLRREVDVDEAADILFLLTSFDSFDSFHTRRRGDLEQVSALLVTTAERTLLR